MEVLVLGKGTRKTNGFGVIGAGLWGQAHADVYATHPNSELIGIYDLNRAKARVLADKHGVKAYDSLDKLLADPEIDAVGIATPDFAHRDPTVAAAEAGKHILVEKPLATKIEDAEAIAAAVRESGVRLMVDFHARWSPPFVVARQSIVEGKLGKVISAYYRLNDVISVPLEMLSWAEESSILWFLGSHAIDTLRWMLDDEVERVYSVSRSGVLKERGLDVPDIYQTILEFESGAIATIENNWIVPNTQPNINDMKMNILGTEGMIDMDLTNNGVIRRYLHDSHDQPDVFVNPTIHGKRVGFAYEAIRDFVERLADGREFITDLVDGVRVTRTIIAIMESAEDRLPKVVQY